MDKKVTVIIPNYNGLTYMEECMEALKNQSCKDFDILVIDNGSEDGSAEWLKEHQIPSVFLTENKGFSGAVNLGIQNSTTPYVILLNNDTKADKHYIREMIRAVEQSPRIFSVSSKMVQMYHPDLMDDAGDMYCLLGWAYQRGVGRSSSGYGRPCRVFAACAGAAIYRREVFCQIGYFDEMHFAYLEDIDVGYRARIAGYDNIYCPTALVYHVGSGTSGSKYNSFKVKLAARNSVYLNYKNMPWPQLMFNLPGILAGIGLKYGFFNKLGFGKDYLEGLKEGIRTAKNCRKVPYKRENRNHYLVIEWELFAATFLYVYEFSRRQMKKVLEKGAVRKKQ
ncbi:MAG: glycosyltransferase family 2 protein [Lachnospiraceae bacterium]|jgi:GT2 family glycosyltransferase|nr:glycosyltransferase family 2 protein [Lachnospiraceae bacterium]